MMGECMPLAVALSLIQWSQACCGKSRVSSFQSSRRSIQPKPGKYDVRICFHERMLLLHTERQQLQGQALWHWCTRRCGDQSKVNKPWSFHDDTHLMCVQQHRVSCLSKYLQALLAMERAAYHSVGSLSSKTAVACKGRFIS